jgi:hypothetical protein
VIPTTATVQGRTFEDRNADGTQLAGENAIGGVTVFADANGNGNLDGGESSTVSNGTGDYTLANVPTGAITIRELPPAGYIVSNPSAGNLNLTGGQTQAGVNFGNFLTAYSGAEMTLRQDAGGFNIFVWIDQPVAGAPTWSAAKALITSLSFTGTSFTDSLTIDMVNGSPLPTGGASYNAGSGGQDNLVIKGSTGAETVDFNAANVTIAGRALNHTNVEAAHFNGLGGNDTLNVNAGANNVVIDGTQHLAALNIAATGAASVPAATNAVIVTNALNISGLLDLNDNDAIVFYSGATPMATVRGYINTARAAGAWTGTAGLTSTNAKNAVPKNKTLGAIESAEYKSVFGAGATFDGEALPGNAVLVKFTYYGDTDFNGIVDFDDYSRTDSGFNIHKTGWFNGDFDGNGQVDFDDYSLIDQAFNTQSGTL